MSLRPALFVVALLLVGRQCFGAPADDLLGVGKKAFADGQYPLAISSLRQIQDEFPESPVAEEAGYLLGVSLFYSGDWAGSLSEFSLIVIRHPKSVFAGRANYWVGAASLKLGNYQTAFDHLSAYLEGGVVAPAYRLSSRLYRAMALEGLGRDSEAARGFREILDDPSAGDYAAEATYRLAGTELRAGRWASARDLYGRILIDYTTSPFVSDSVFFIGECELSLGNLVEAEKRYRTLLSLYPDSRHIEAATFRLSDVAWRQGRPDALRRLDDFLSRFPGGDYRGSALRLRGDILAGQGKTAEAMADYSRATALLADGPERQAAWYAMGRAQVSLGRTLEAAASFARAGSGGSAAIAEKAGFQRAVLLAGAGHAAEAIEALRSFLKAFPASPRAEEARRLLGSLLEKAGDREAARAQWESLADNYPASAGVAEYVYRGGMDLLAAGRLSSALDDFQRVLKEHPGSEWAGRSSYAIGYIYASRGEYPRALPFFRSAHGPRGDLAAAISLFNMGRFDQAAPAFLALQHSKGAAVSTGTAALYVGRSLYRTGRLEEAAARLGDAAAALAAEGSPLGADAQYWRGWALLRLRRPAEAYGAFLAVSEGYPDDPRRFEALLRAGVCESMQSDDASALSLYEQVIDSHPGAVTETPQAAGSISGSGTGAATSGAQDGTPSIVEQAMYERVQALSRLGRAADSADALESLVREFPRGRLGAQALYSRAERARGERRFRDAHSDFRRVARDFPGSSLAAQAAYLSAESLLLAGDARGALDGFWACLSGSAGTGFVAQEIEGFTSALGVLADVEVAREFARKVQAAQGLSAEAASGVTLSCAEEILGSAPDEARALIDQVRRSTPPEPYAGEASLLLGKYASIRSDWSRALDIFGALEGSRADDIGARAALEKGRTLEAMGRTSEAVDEFLKVAYLFPDFSDRAAEGMSNAARVAEVRGEKDRATKIEQALRKAYPESRWIGALPPG